MCCVELIQRVGTVDRLSWKMERTEMEHLASLLPDLMTTRPILGHIGAALSSVTYHDGSEDPDAWALGITYYRLAPSPTQRDR